MTGEHVAAAMSYVLFWISGLLFLLFDRRPFVRFHATQSIVVFGGISLFDFALGELFGFDVFFHVDWTDLQVVWIFLAVVHLLVFVLWMGCILKASQGQRFEIPLAAVMAKAFAGE